MKEGSSTSLSAESNVAGAPGNMLEHARGVPPVISI